MQINKIYITLNKIIESTEIYFSLQLTHGHYRQYLTSNIQTLKIVHTMKLNFYQGNNNKKINYTYINIKLLQLQF